MEKAGDFCIVYVTTNSFDNASQIAKILVSERLAACATIVMNIVSIFGWQGAVQESHEFLIMIKTTFEKLESLEERVSQVHPYEVPQIIAVRLDSASEPYLNWMKEILDDRCVE